MLFVNILLVAGFAWPSTHLLILYLRAEEEKEKPKKSEVAGIVTVTVVMAAYLIWLMACEYFY